MQMFILSPKIFLFKLIMLSPMHLNLLIIQDTWEEVDPDELSYEVSWLGLPMMLLLNFIPYSTIHLRSCLHWVKLLEPKAEAFQLLQLLLCLQ